MDDSNELEIWFRSAIVAGLSIGAIAAGATVVIGHIWFSWRFFAAFLVLAAALLGSEYVYARRERMRRERLTA
jgi:hypothetical protein